jgi:hypothetical protein
MTSSLFASYIAIWLLVLFQGLIIIALLRELAELRPLAKRGATRDEELAVGSVAPHFASTDRSTGRKLDIYSVNEQGGVLLFVSPTCRVCRRLVGNLQLPVMQALPSIFVWCEGGDQACAEYARQLPSEIHFLMDGAEATAARYHVSAFPTAVVVDRNHIVRGYAHPKNVEDLKRLVVSSLGSKTVVGDFEDGAQSAAFGSGGVQ